MFEQLSSTEKGNQDYEPTARRRRFLEYVIFVILMALAGLSIIFNVFPFKEALPNDPLARALYLMDRHPLIDTHNDLPIKITWSGKKDLDIKNLDESVFATDISRMRKGKMGGQFWSGFVPCEDYQRWPGGPVLFTLNQIDLIKRMTAANDDLQFATTAEGIRAAFKSGKIASLIGIEGGHQINGSLSVLRQYRELGVLYMTLTHACHTSWADSCAKEAIHNGLTDFGKEIVSEMNRIGMLVDISHVSHKVMSDVIETTKAPLFASHSDVYSLCNTTRNIPDFVLDAMGKLDGVIMINFWNALVTCSNKATLEDVANQMEYIRNRVGAKHVGIGADLDGIGLADAAVGVADVSRYPFLLAELIKRGFSDEEVVGIMGENLLRVLQKTEDVATAVGQH